MIYSIEMPPERPKLSNGIRTAWLMILLAVIIGTAIYCAVSFGEVRAYAAQGLEILGLNTEVVEFVEPTVEK